MPFRETKHYDTDRKKRSCPLMGIAFAMLGGKANEMLSDDFLCCDAECCALWADDRQCCGLIAPTPGLAP